ncbi:MAG: alpha/beta fold hydrolase [Geodermatophilaceae bacterium]
MDAYCPYDVTPLLAQVAGTEQSVSTAFGRLRCLTKWSGRIERWRRGTVFVHGVHDDMNSWGPLVREAARRAVDLGPTLFVDLPGFGRSQNRRSRLDLIEVGDMLMRVATKEMGFESVRLVGHSMGTLVVADMAVRHAARVESLHLAAGPYYSVVDTMNGHPSGGYAGGLATAAFGSQYLLALTAGLGVATVRMASRRQVLRPLLAPYAAHPNDLRQSVVDHLVSGMRPRSFRAAARNGFDYRDRHVLVQGAVPGLGGLRRGRPAGTRGRRPAVAGRHPCRANHPRARRVAPRPSGAAGRHALGARSDLTQPG